jgi:hypothetical protein
MDHESITRELAETAHRLRHQAFIVCQGSWALVRLSQETRATIRQRMEERVRLAKTFREQIIARRLLTGRLPCASAPVIVGKPGDGGKCDGCDKPLTSAQTVMAIPFERTFVHLHAECFSVWDATRPHTGEGKIH